MFFAVAMYMDYIVTEFYMQHVSYTKETLEQYKVNAIKLIEIDDRDLANTPNWWQLIVYKSQECSGFILESIFWRNYPKSLPPLTNLSLFQKVDDMMSYLVDGCCMPESFAQELIAKTKRTLDVLAKPHLALDLPLEHFTEQGDENDCELEYYDPVFVEDMDSMEAAVYTHANSVMQEEKLSAYI